MFGTGVLILQPRHLAIGPIQNCSQIVSNAQIDSGPENLGPLLQIHQQLLLQLIDRHLQLLQERPRDSIGLLEKRQQEVIVPDLLMIVLRCEILRGLKRFLHFLRESIDTHLAYNNERTVGGNGPAARKTIKKLNVTTNRYIIAFDVRPYNVR
jgi:hypothetical protein